MRFRFAATALLCQVPLTVGLCFLTSSLRAQEAGAGSTLSDEEFHRERAATELHEEEQQRILGIMPNFNASNIADAEALLPQQKLQLALKGVLDPFTFVAAGFDSALSQAGNDFGSYGQGASGYGKRFGASYLDTFDGTMLGNALFPILLKQDPRYFRKGTGSFRNRLFYALSSTYKCKNDSGDWVPNYSNFLGNFAAGGLSNLYYPSSDRGFSLTLQRTLVVTAEDTGGAILMEFWPDISRKVFPKRHRDGVLAASQSQP